MKKTLRPFYLKAAVAATAALLFTNVASAQDTYWALLGNKRINTQTGKVIGSRPNDAEVGLTDVSLGPICSKGMFDATGRCLFTMQGGNLSYSGTPLLQTDGGMIAFPLSSDPNSCKHYGVVNVIPVAGRSGTQLNSGRQATYQLVDANGVDGTANPQVLPTAVSALQYLLDSHSPNSQLLIDATARPIAAGIRHDIFTIVTSDSLNRGWISDFNIPVDGVYHDQDLDHATNVAITGVDANGLGYEKYLPIPEGKMRVHPVDIGGQWNNAHIVYRCFMPPQPPATPGGNVIPGYYALIWIDWVNNMIGTVQPMPDDVYGLEFAMVGNELRCYYATANEIGYITETSGKVAVLSGTKSDLSIGRDGRIYYATGDPAISAGSLRAFVPTLDPTDQAQYDFVVSGSANLVPNIPIYDNAANIIDRCYQFGNMIQGPGQAQAQVANTSIAQNYDVYDDYFAPAGNTTWTAASNPVVEYNGGGGPYPPMSFKGKVTVPAGSNLTVKGMNLKMGDNAAMFVESAAEGKWGARLTLDGATINKYSSCDNTVSFWPGIQVLGDNTKTQQDQGINGENYQGRLDMINDATISDARLAVQTLRADDPKYVSGGGIFYATKAHFTNNRKAVGYNPYSYQSSAGIYPYRSQILNSEFRADASLGNDFVGFISGWGAHGVSVSGSSFTNNAVVDVDNSFGVAGYDFGVKVTNPYLGNGCTFTNLHHGVDISTIAGMQNMVTVKNANIKGSEIGIKTAAVNLPFITGNTVYLGENTLGWPCGVDVETGSGFQLAGNHFIGSSTNSNQAGVFVDRAGSSDNQVHNNTYESINVGNLSNGVNRGKDANGYDIGLEFTCNTHTTSTTDEAIVRTGAAGEGIKATQGTTAAPAGNVFTNAVGMSTAIFNQTPSVDYYYNVNDPSQLPVTRYGLVQPISTFNSNPCTYTPPKINGGGAGDGGTTDGGGGRTNKRTPTELIADYFDGLDADAPIDINAVSALLDSWQSPYSRLTKVDLLVEMGQTAQASSLYNSINEAYPMENTEATEFNTYGRQLLDIRIALKNANTHLKDLNATQVAILESVAVNGQMWAKVRAQNWLGLYDGRTFEQIAMFPTEGTPASKNSAVSSMATGISVYPNPVRDYLNITYHNTASAGALLEITDLTGKLMQQQHLEGKNGTVVLHVQGLAPGMYLYKVTEGKAVMQQGKIVKQ